MASKLYTIKFLTRVQKYNNAASWNIPCQTFHSSTDAGIELADSMYSANPLRLDTKIHEACGALLAF